MENTRNGAMALPTEEPLSYKATARPRSDLGNHSETVLAAPGQLAASPVPRRNRKNMKLLSPAAAEVMAAASEYQLTVSSSPRRVPSQSSRRPATVCITVYATRKAITTRAQSELFQENSSLRCGASTLRVCRSM